MEKPIRQWIKSNLISIAYICVGIIFSITIGMAAKEGVLLNKNDNGKADLQNGEQYSETFPAKQETSDTGSLEGNVESFFSDAVFVGDSIMYGFEKYTTKNEEDFLGGPKFLTAGNFAVRLNLEPVSEQSTHPIYKGEKCTIEQAISLMNVKKAFLFFGLNDIAISGIEGTLENYYTCIQRIRGMTPDIKIYIMSATYLAKGSEKQILNNGNLRLFNEKLKENSVLWETEFIDVASPLTDESGYLAARYCSDGYVHQTEEAYDLWVKVLIDFASEQ